MKNTKILIGKNNTSLVKKNLFDEINNSINNDENLLIFSDNTVYYDKFKKNLDLKDYNPYVLNLKESMNSNSYNPLILPYYFYKKGNKDKAVDLINDLAKEIFKSDKHNSDPFWDNSAADYFTTLVLILFREGKEEEINLGSIQAMSTLAEKNYDNTTVIKKYFDNLDIIDNIYMIGSQIVYAPTDTRGSIISVMKQKLNFFCIREVLLNNLCGNQIDLTNLQNKTAIFIIGNEKLNRISNILIDQLCELNVQYSYYFDNFDDMTSLYKLSKLVKNDKKVVIVTNSKEELISKYDKFLIEKIDNIIYLDELHENLDIPNITLPTSNITKHQYFNLEEYVKNN